MVVIPATLLISFDGPGLAQYHRYIWQQTVRSKLNHACHVNYVDQHVRPCIIYSGSLPLILTKLALGLHRVPPETPISVLCYTAHALAIDREARCWRAHWAIRTHAAYQPKRQTNHSVVLCRGSFQSVLALLTATLPAFGTVVAAANAAA